MLQGKITPNQNISVAKPTLNFDGFEQQIQTLREEYRNI